MTLFITIGIDPGQSGAVAVLVNGEFAEVHSMPLEAKRKGSQIDCRALAALASGIRERCASCRNGSKRSMVGVEQVSANPHQGVSSMFSFGDSFGCARFFAALLDMPMVLVPASRWKTAMRLNLSPEMEKSKRYAEGKRYALTRARRLFPAAEADLSLRKHEGRAEALLLARYLHDFPTNA